MKVPYSFFSKRFKKPINIEELSEKFFQLGHEHKVNNQIFDFELTPNRGDCLSLNGLLRDLKALYDVNNKFEKYSKPLNTLSLDFNNKAQEDCPHISFLKIEIEKNEGEQVYKEYIEDYFTVLDNKKINFFTDISNYVSYELGQPTHCYDFSKLDEQITLERLKTKKKFKTLFDNEIQLSGDNLVFTSGNKIINLAGVMGGYETMCDHKTNTVLVECAYFKPESIIGKSLRYDLNSDAAHKFERNVDPMSHENVLNRFIKIVSDHAKINTAEIICFNYAEYKENEIEIDVNKINKILGTNITIKEYEKILRSLSFEYGKNIVIPSWRNDIITQNDLAEEVARVIGYNNIDQLNFNDSIDNPDKDTQVAKVESSIIELLVENGFYESINFPFNSVCSETAIKIDNPIDSNKPFMRESIKQSLLDNLMFNERRQQDSIKFFELSDVYRKNKDLISRERKLGVVASGRVNNNYLSFNKKIDENYMKNIFSDYIKDFDRHLTKISREDVNSKIKSQILYFEIDIGDIDDKIINYKSKLSRTKNFARFKKVSDYPSIFRDLSFSVKDFNQIENLEKLILNYSNENLIESFIFDFFHNKKNNEVKIGFRFRFQSNKTLTDVEVDKVINDIIKKSMNIKDITIPGLKK